MLEVLFPSPIFRHDPPDGERLLLAVQEHLAKFPKEEAVPGHSTRGGSQTPPTFFNRDDPAVEMLRVVILRALRDYLPQFHQLMTRPGAPRPPLDFDLWGWVTSFDQQGWNAPHIHPLSLISGVYWVETPSQVLENRDGDFAGWLGFQDPRTGSQTWPLPGHVSNHFMPPRPGTLVLFPSYLSHFVPPFMGDGVRTSIAFNLRHKSGAGF
jgi:hypothetical protein